MGFDCGSKWIFYIIILYAEQMEKRGVSVAKMHQKWLGSVLHSVRQADASRDHRSMEGGRPIRRRSASGGEIYLFISDANYSQSYIEDIDKI